MFQNTYQNGTYFDLFDPKTSADKVKNLYKISNVQGNNKVFDKDLKTYVFEFNSPNAKISFPREDKKDLYLIQQFLNLQIYLSPGMSWNIELAVSDLNRTKRRINLSSATHKFEKKTFFVKYPCPIVKEGLWNNFVVDLYSFMNAFKGQTYRSLDAIQISGHFKLRRIFTTQSPHDETVSMEELKPTNFLPKNFYYPPAVQSAAFLVAYEEDCFIEEAYEPTESSTKNGSNIRSKQRQLSTPKTANLVSQKKIGYKDQKKFLANTNGPEIMKRKGKKETDNQSSEKSQFTETKTKTPASTDKNINKRKVLGKTQIPKARSSIEKKKELQIQKNKVKGKLNPWRTNTKQENTDGGQSQFSNSKIQQSRQLDSAQTTLFKTKNNLVKFNQSKNKGGFDRKSDLCSDSDYIELSHKFSTVTDGKFFKNELASQQFNINNNQAQQNHQEDEIQQNIQMETNSIYSNSNQKKEKDIKNQFLNEKQIAESINDSLDDLPMKKKQSGFKKQIQEAMMSSHYGFGEKVMNKFMQQIERPYSPPLGERELSEQQYSERHEQADEKEVELIYDPVLNCYYDHKTHTYYELKN